MTTRTARSVGRGLRTAGRWWKKDAKAAVRLAKDVPSFIGRTAGHTIEPLKDDLTGERLRAERRARQLNPVDQAVQLPPTGMQPQAGRTTRIRTVRPEEAVEGGGPIIQKAANTGTQFVPRTDAEKLLYQENTTDERGGGSARFIPIAKLGEGEFRGETGNGTLFTGQAPRGGSQGSTNVFHEGGTKRGTFDDAFGDRLRPSQPQPEDRGVIGRGRLASTTSFFDKGTQARARAFLNRENDSLIKSVAQRKQIRARRDREERQAQRESEVEIARQTGEKLAKRNSSKTKKMNDSFRKSDEYSRMNTKQQKFINDAMKWWTNKGDFINRRIAQDEQYDDIFPQTLNEKGEIIGNSMERSYYERLGQFGLRG